LQYYEYHNTRPHWFQTAYPNSPITAVAYFSLEFMLSDALPIYSGGLGNVAGDQLKAASDLGVPVYGVGLLYQQGYFRQRIDADGHQEALYPYNDPTQLPISPLRDPNGEWLRISIHLPGIRLWLRTWEVRVGGARLFLLDSNDPGNLPDYRGFTSELYSGGPETRLQQERILGIAGWRLLRALGLRPKVCHLNEGHAAFAVLERARDFMGRPSSRSKWPSRQRAPGTCSRRTRRSKQGLTASRGLLWNGTSAAMRKSGSVSRSRNSWHWAG
jgi:starch phosphorylase